MKISCALLFLMLPLTFNYGQALPEQQEQVRAAFDSFNRSLADLTKRFGNKSRVGIEAKIARSLDSITENVKFLEAVMKLRNKMPPEYLEGVSLDAELLRELASRKPKNAVQLNSLYDGLNEVDSDLRLKVTGPRNGGEVARVVEVVVRAKRGNQEVGAYQVWYVTKGWAKDSSKFRPFDRLTDPSIPSSMKLAPGNYFIWLGKNRITDPQPASIGAHGETRREIELSVP